MKPRKAIYTPDGRDILILSFKNLVKGLAFKQEEPERIVAIVENEAGEIFLAELKDLSSMEEWALE